MKKHIDEDFGLDEFELMPVLQKHKLCHKGLFDDLVAAINKKMDGQLHSIERIQRDSWIHSEFAVRQVMDEATDYESLRLELCKTFGIKYRLDRK
jgi:hypothetical protein